MANKELYSNGRFNLGIVNEWGVFLRDRQVAQETSLEVDGFSKSRREGPVLTIAKLRMMCSGPECVLYASVGLCL